MRILVIDQCSKQKAYPDDVSPIGADVLDAHSLSELQARDEMPAIEARELYTGRQQRKIGEGMRMLEREGHEVDRYFISAGFGLVDDTERLPPYNVTFNDMTNSEIDARAEKLGIADDVQDLLESEPPYDVVYFAVGRDYYRSLDLETTLRRLPDESVGVVFNQDEEDVEQLSNVVSVSARTEEAKEFGTIVVALKGVYLKNLADELKSDEVLDAEQLVEYCLSQQSSQAGFEEF